MRGQQRVKAEAEGQTLAAQTGLPLHIFRLAGIYGPGRGPFAKLRRGTARRIIKENQVFSRIHVDDIAQVLRASVGAPNPGRIYNVCDDLAAPPEDVLAYGAKLLGVDIPPDEAFKTAQMSPMARSFYSESKRVKNTRIKTELQIELAFPTYREGLEDLMRLENSSA
jgi:nucleoside-diphosphate-sugar epimerase